MPDLGRPNCGSSKDRKTLTVAFDNGERFELAAEYLRVKSPSAEVQGHSPDERKTVPGKRDVMILEIQPIGNYAVRLVFDDMHSTGIYSWDYLPSLAATTRATGRIISTSSPARVCRAIPPSGDADSRRSSDDAAYCSTITLAPTFTRL